MPKVKDLMEWLKTYAPEQPIAYALWTLDDVFHVAEEQEKTLSEDEAEAILQTVHETQDAEGGINWSFIEFCMENPSS